MVKQSKQVVTLDNGSITLLALAIAYAMKLEESGEMIGPSVRKVQEYIEDIQTKVPHFKP